MTNWTKGGSGRGTWDNPSSYNANVSMEMGNSSVIHQAGNSNDVTVFQIPTADAYDYQYLIQNLTVTAFNFNDSGAYVGLRLRLIYTVGTSGTMVSNKLINITGNRTIGPNQTAQIISKDAPIVMGYTFGGTAPDFSGAGRIWKLDARTQRDANLNTYAEMHFHVSYLKISRVSE